MRRARPRQHVRRVRGRSILINHGVKRRVHKRYIGFNDRERRMIDKTFGENPRLEFKKQHAVRDIVKADGNKENFPGNDFKGAFGSERKRIALSDQAFTSDEQLKTTVSHEITHASHAAKIPERFDKEFDKKPKLGFFSRLFTGADKEDSKTIEYYGNPTERLARKEANKENLKSFDQEVADSRPITGPAMRKYIEHNEESFKKDLRESDNLRDLPPVWEDE